MTNILNTLGLISTIFTIIAACFIIEWIKNDANPAIVKDAIAQPQIIVEYLDFKSGRLFCYTIGDESRHCFKVTEKRKKK